MKDTVCGLYGKMQNFHMSPTNLMQHIQNNYPNSIPKDYAVVDFTKNNADSTHTCPKIDSKDN